MRRIPRLFAFPTMFTLTAVALGGLHCGGNDAPGSPVQPPDIPGGGCDASKPLDQGGCDVSDGAGIFVAPTGADTNPGTKAAPLKTVQAGIDKAKADPARRNVYVCTGTYPESIALDGAADGVAIHGGFGCGDWVYAATTVTLAPTKPGYVVRVKESASVVETFELRAMDADTPGGSSIVVFVEAATGMTFRRVKIFAGKGADGNKGDSATAVLTPANDGNDAAQEPGAERVCSCGSASKISTGGAGGGGSGKIASAGAPLVTGADASAGKPYPNCASSGSAGAYDGANGLDGELAKGASSIGSVSSNGWAPEPGQPGNEGGIGQGGGGGAGTPGVHLSPGGGCGGCGGKAGGAGQGGGASIGVIALNSVVRVQTSAITTSDAGNGGKGGDGSLGQPGGKSGAPAPAGFPYCKGGTGGRGGIGSGGGGGAGGSSIGVVAVGQNLFEVDKATVFTIGSAKPGAPGGGPKFAAGGSGIDGLAIRILGPK
jgi:hypothetical protein